MTTRPNEQLGWLHDRMPVVLADDAWERWLDPGLEDPAELHGLFEPSDEVELSIWPVNALVNNVRNDGPELIAPIDAAELQRVRGESAMPGLFDGVLPG